MRSNKVFISVLLFVLLFGSISVEKFFGSDDVSDIKYSEKLRHNMREMDENNEGTFLIYLTIDEFNTNRLETIEESTKLRFEENLNSDINIIRPFIVNLREEKQLVYDQIILEFSEIIREYHCDIIKCSQSSMVIIRTTFKNIKIFSNYQEISKIYILDSNPIFENNGLFDELVGSIYVLGNKLDYKAIINLDLAKQYYSVNGNPLDGSGVIIGISEVGGGIDYTHPSFSGRVDLHTIGSSNHATTVGLIAAGSDGVATNSTIMSTAFLSSGGYTDIVNSLNYLVGVCDVINLSWAAGSQTQPSYFDDLSIWFDVASISSHNIFVKASGNESTFSIDSLGLAKNTITVGGTNNLGTSISSFSTYLTNSDINKPTIVAPAGEYSVQWGLLINTVTVYALDVPLSPMPDVNVLGTSFAAPQVTGVIALLLQKYPLNYYNPENIISALTAGASFESLSNIGNISNYLSEKGGSGLLNVYNTFKILGQSDFMTYSHYNSPIGSIVKEYTFNLNANDTIILSHYYQISAYTTIHGTNIPNFNILLYFGGNLVQSTNSVYSNLERIKYVVPQSGEYTLKIKVINKYEPHTDYGAISIFSLLGANFILTPHSTGGSC